MPAIPEVSNPSVRAVVHHPAGTPEALALETLKALGPQVGSAVACTGESTAQAFNRGALEPGTHEYLIFCQVGVRPALRAVGIMRHVLDSDPGVGIVGPVSDGPVGLQQVAQPGQHYRTDYGFKLFGDYIAMLHRASHKPCPRVDSFFLMIRRSAYELLGGFDTRFTPGFFEDDDLCNRLSTELDLVPAIAYGAWVDWSLTPPWPYPISPEECFETNKRRYEKKWASLSRLTLVGQLPPERGVGIGSH